MGKLGKCRVWVRGVGVVCGLWVRGCVQGVGKMVGVG